MPCQSITCASLPARCAAHEAVLRVAAVHYSRSVSRTGPRRLPCVDYGAMAHRGAIGDDAAASFFLFLIQEFFEFSEFSFFVLSAWIAARRPLPPRRPPPGAEVSSPPPCGSSTWARLGALACNRDWWLLEIGDRIARDPFSTLSERPLIRAHPLRWVLDRMPFRKFFQTGGRDAIKSELVSGETGNSLCVLLQHRT